MTFKGQKQQKAKTKTTPSQTLKATESKLYVYHAELQWDFKVICKLGQVAYEISETGSDAF